MNINCHECITQHGKLQGEPSYVRDTYYLILISQPFEAYITIKWIAGRSRYSEETTRKAFKVLKKKGMIVYRASTRTWLPCSLDSEPVYEHKKPDYMFSRLMRLKEQREEEERTTMAKMNWRKEKIEKRSSRVASGRVITKELVYEESRLGTYSRGELKAFLDAMMEKYYKLKGSDSHAANVYYENTIESVRRQYHIAKRREGDYNPAKEARRQSMDRTSSFRKQC